MSQKWLCYVPGYLPRGDLFVMENLEFLFLPALMKQNFVLKAVSHGGDFELKTDLFLEKQLSSKFSNLQLQRIPRRSLCHGKP